MRRFLELAAESAEKCWSWECKRAKQGADWQGQAVGHRRAGGHHIRLGAALIKMDEGGGEDPFAAGQVFSQDCVALRGGGVSKFHTASRTVAEAAKALVTSFQRGGGGLSFFPVRRARSPGFLCRRRQLNRQRRP